MAIAEMYPRIPWELVADTERFAKHNLGTASSVYLVTIYGLYGRGIGVRFPRGTRDSSAFKKKKDQTAFVAQ